MDGRLCPGLEIMNEELSDMGFTNNLCAPGHLILLS